jgi:hypothetical protein
MSILHKFCDLIEVPGKSSYIEYFVKYHTKQILYILSRTQFQSHSSQNIYIQMAITLVISFQF